MSDGFARILWVTGAALALTTGGLSRVAAQPASAAQTPAPAASGAAAAAEEISGRIDAIAGRYTLRVRDDRGYLDSVTLHRGTIIVPSGLTLKPGMLVRISGTSAGATFAADVVKTPYSAPSPRAGFSGSGCTGAADGIPNSHATGVPVGPIPGLPAGSC